MKETKLRRGDRVRSDVNPWQAHRLIKPPKQFEDTPSLYGVVACVRGWHQIGPAAEDLPLCVVCWPEGETP